MHSHRSKDAKITRSGSPSPMWTPFRARPPRSERRARREMDGGRRCTGRQPRYLRFHKDDRHGLPAAAPARHLHAPSHDCHRATQRPRSLKNGVLFTKRAQVNQSRGGAGRSRASEPGSTGAWKGRDRRKLKGGDRLRREQQARVGDRRPGVGPPSIRREAERDPRRHGAAQPTRAVARTSPASRMVLPGSVPRAGPAGRRESRTRVYAMGRPKTYTKFRGIPHRSWANKEKMRGLRQLCLRFGRIPEVQAPHGGPVTRVKRAPSSAPRTLMSPITPRARSRAPPDAARAAASPASHPGLSAGEA